MNIIEIEIQNNKHIRCFKKRLDGKNMIVAGDTGTGKTTAISALWDIMKKCPDALTHGEKKGMIKVKLSDGSKVINAVRTTTKKASTITITDHEGDDISITDFKGMISTLSVDPHLIAAMKPTEQLRTLAAAAGIEGIEAMDANIGEAENNRLDLFRQMEAIAPGEEPEKVEPVDVSALVAEKTVADNHNFDYDSKRRDLDGIIEHGKRLASEVENLEGMLKAKNAEKDELHDEAVTLKSRVADMSPIDTTGLTTKIANAQTTNDAAAAHRNWSATAERHEAKVAGHAAAGARVTLLRAAKKDALANANWPIDGLTIDDGNILYNDCLLSNLGDSQQLLVCAAIAVKGIASKPIKVVRMDRVESMSPNDLAALEKVFNDSGVQVLATRVTWGDTRPEEIVIAEGVYTDTE